MPTHTRQSMTQALTARHLGAIRWAAAIVFVVFGAGKFVNHGSELASFRAYALPAPEVFVYAVGILELVGGLLLASRRAVRPIALVLAADMIGAIVVSGLGRGEILSLTLAPALLVAMLALLGIRVRRDAVTPPTFQGHRSAAHRPDARKEH